MGNRPSICSNAVLQALGNPRSWAYARKGNEGFWLPRIALRRIHARGARFRGGRALSGAGSPRPLPSGSHVSERPRHLPLVWPGRWTVGALAMRASPRGRTQQLIQNSRRVRRTGLFLQAVGGDKCRRTSRLRAAILGIGAGTARTTPLGPRRAEQLALAGICAINARRSKQPATVGRNSPTTGTTWNPTAPPRTNDSCPS
jgi:hypothetical protein